MGKKSYYLENLVGKQLAMESVPSLKKNFFQLRFLIVLFIYPKMILFLLVRAWLTFLILVPLVLQNQWSLNCFMVRQRAS